MVQRPTRAKEKIRQAGIPFRVPARLDLPERLDAVLAVTYLVFTEGFAPTGQLELIRDDLRGEASRLCRLLDERLPEHAAVEAPLANQRTNRDISCSSSRRTSVVSYDAPPTLEQPRLNGRWHPWRSAFNSTERTSP